MESTYFGLSLVLISLFVLFFAGQTVFGWLNYNDDKDEHHQPQIGLGQYLGTGAFGEAVFENWESEFLQMGLYVILTVFLFQRGSSESKDPDKKEEVDENGASKTEDPNVPLPVKKGGFILMLYNHSLSLAFMLLFLISFVGHAVCGAKAHNEEALEHGKNVLSVWQYLGTSQFWFESFQNWQSEFLAIFTIVVLSIWLREKGSPNRSPLRLLIRKPQASMSQTPGNLNRLFLEHEFCARMVVIKKGRSEQTAGLAHKSITRPSY